MEYKEKPNLMDLMLIQLLHKSGSTRNNHILFYEDIANEKSLHCFI